MDKMAGFDISLFVSQCSACGLSHEIDFVYQSIDKDYTHVGLCKNTSKSVWMKFITEEQYNANQSKSNVSA